MIDPTKFTNYNRSQYELEEALLFCIAVAGKNATTTARLLDKLLHHGGFCYDDESPFQTVRDLHSFYNLYDLMRDVGFGCYNLKGKGFLSVAFGDMLNLRRCSVADLEAIPGVGMKTSRFFILHTRKNAKVACLDTHILKWLEYYTGYEVPKHTPAKTKYLELERAFIQIAKTMKMSPADLDLRIWNKQRGSDEESVAKARKNATKQSVDH